MIRPFGVLLVLFALLGVPSKAQLSNEFTGMNNLRKQKWEKAKLQFNKVLLKDSMNSAALYGLSIYYFSPSNPNYLIDSAYQYVVEALLKYQGVPPRYRDRWRKIPMDSVFLIRHRERIDSAAFERALKINSEDGYIDFANRFPTASQKTLALELRDEVAYLDALRINTYHSFLSYLNKYPNAARAPEARVKYEKLLFETKTKDRGLISYEAFLLEYPSTPYRKIAEQQIFEISTASGHAEDFMMFLKKYPESSKVNTARNILFHILKEEDKPYQSILNDSIRKIEMLGQMHLVPFLKEGKFGFMNERGEDILFTDAEELDKSLRCGNIVDELLVLDVKIIARNGAVIYDGKIDEVEDLGYGFLKITESTCVRVIHYSGFSIGGSECFQNATMLGSNYLAIQKKNKWGVWTLTGRMLLPFDWDEILSIGSNVIALAKADKFKLTTVKEIAKIADQAPIKFHYNDVEDVKQWPGGNIWIRMGDKQAVLNQDLTEWIAMDTHEISLTFFGAVSKNSSGYTLHSKKTEKIEFTQVKINNSWVAGKSEVGWQLWNPIETPNYVYDSIGFLGPMAFGFNEDSMHVHLSDKALIEAVRTTKVQFLAGKDSIYFLVMEESDKKRVYNSNGEMLFLAPFDKIEYNNEGFFTVYKKEKKGLMSDESKLIIQPENDAIGAVTDGVVTVLKEKKFGLVNVRTRQQIKTEYEKNLLNYNATNLIAFKNGFYGIIRWDNKPVTPFEFEEIKYWNDSSALVKRNFNWILYNFIEKKIIIDKIKNFKWVVDTEQEKIMVFQEENKYGVLSNKRGVIIAPTFSDIINLGSSLVPLYFSEKHVEEAGIYVVIYYDKDGRQLRKQVFETDDYEKIYCVGNN